MKPDNFATCGLTHLEEEIRRHLVAYFSQSGGMADTPDLKSGAGLNRREGSTPSSSTNGSCQVKKGNKMIKNNIVYYRSRRDVAKEAKEVFNFVKAAPKAGRRYSEMIKKVFEIRGGEKWFGSEYDSYLDRNLLTPIMKHLKLAGVIKCVDGRYRVK